MFGKEHGTPPGAESWKISSGEAPLKEASDEEIDAALNFDEAEAGKLEINKKGVPTTEKAS